MLPLWAILAGVGGAAYLMLSKSAQGSSQAWSPGAPNQAAFQPWSADVATPPPNPAAYPPGGWSASAAPGQTDVQQQAAELGLAPQEYWNMLFPSNPATAATPLPVPPSAYVGAGLAPGAHHAAAPPPPVFDRRVWAWVARGPMPSSPPPQRGGGTWQFVTELVDEGFVVERSGGFALPAWVWYPLASTTPTVINAYGVPMTSGTPTVIGPPLIGPHGLTGRTMHGVQVINGGLQTVTEWDGPHQVSVQYPAGYLQMFPGYWVNDEQLYYNPLWDQSGEGSDMGPPGFGGGGTTPPSGSGGGGSVTPPGPPMPPAPPGGAPPLPTTGCMVGARFDPMSKRWY